MKLHWTLRCCARGCASWLTTRPVTWCCRSAELPFISNVSRVLSFGLFLPFMAYGLVLSIVCGSLSKQSSGFRTSDLGLLHLFIGVYTVIHLLSWALIRYRLPVDAVLLLFAGLAVVHLWHRLAQRYPLLLRTTDYLKI